MIDLSIIIVNWNTRDLLAQCLQSVYDTVRGLEFEVFVVDNASTDGSAAMVRERFPQVQLIENGENVGFARANNQAIERSTGHYVLLLNSDTVVTPGAIEALVKFADLRPDAGAVGPQLLNGDGSFQASYAQFPTLWTEVLLLWGIARVVYSRYFPSNPPEHSQETCECDWVGGACLLVRKEAIAEVGTLDEDYFLYVEEADWCYRLKQRGWKILYYPDARIVHYGGRSSDQWDVSRRIHLHRSKLLFFRKHRGWVQEHIFRANIRVSAFLKSALWAIVSPLLGKRYNQAYEKYRVYRALVEAHL